VLEFLTYLQSVHQDWSAALAFYEVSRDALVSVYEYQNNHLTRRDVTFPVDQLPDRLVRKFFHPSAFFNQVDRRSLLSHLFHSSPSYEPDAHEATQLRPLIPIPAWQSCVCMALADQEDMLAMLVLASPKKNAFNSKAIGNVIPVKSVAALALAQQLHRAARGRELAEADQPVATAEFQDRIRRLNQQTEELEEDNRVKAEKLVALSQEIELLDKNSSEYRQELERVKVALFALEEQTEAATQHLTDAYTQLTQAQYRLKGLDQTMGFMKDVFQVLSQEHDSQEFSHTMVTWFCQHFGVERCSLMLLDNSCETLQIAAQCGIDPSIVNRVKVRVGQGVAGWVAHNRKPLFVRVREDRGSPHTGQDVYNSDSFICVPLIYNNRVFGVLNLSNKRDGEPFDETDLDRALMAGAVLAMTLGGQETARRTAAWA